MALGHQQRHAWLFVLIAGTAVALFHCEENGNTATNTSTGTGEGGCPPQGPPAPLFTLKVTAMRGPLPEDTTLRVRWSAGDEPEFVLGQPDTWMTLEQGSNVVCQVPHDAGPPTDMTELVCELWTSGATEIDLTAQGYLPHNQTLTPKTIDECEDPVPSEVEVDLTLDLDAGTGR